MKSTFILPWFVLLWAAFGCQSTADDSMEPTKPNILFLFADDLSYETIGALGYEKVQTPHLDRLVNMGTTFTHTYNMGGWNGAICVASRSMLISGRYLWEAQEMANRWGQGDSTALEQTWGRLMAQAGYDTYMSGKWHVRAPSSHVFDTVRHERPGMPPDAWGKGGGGKGVSDAIKNGGDVAAAMPVGYNYPRSREDKSWDPTDTTFGGFWSGGQHWSEVVRDDGMNFIHQAAEKENPFFMYLAFNAAHDPRQAPQEFLDQYPVNDIPVPENYLEVYPDYDKIGLGPGLRDEALAPFPRTEYAVQKHRQEYFALITHMDEQIGQILDALESSGQMENTYIVFTGDHGLSVGHHGLLGKQSMYDHSMRVPFIVTGPGVPPGEQRDQAIYLQDVMPTSLEWADVKIPDYVDFHSITRLLQEPEADSPYPEVYGAYMNIHRMVVSGDYKLIVYPTINTVKLYNLAEDPQEIHNLADLPEYGKKVEEMKGKLHQLMEDMDDPLDASL